MTYLVKVLDLIACAICKDRYRATSRAIEVCTFKSKGKVCSWNICQTCRPVHTAQHRENVLGWRPYPKGDHLRYTARK